jgi:predicted secreted protein
LAVLLKDSNKTNKFGGITTTTQSHLNTSYQIKIALGQCKKRLVEVSTLPAQLTKSLGASGARIWQKSRLSLVGILS